MRKLEVTKASTHCHETPSILKESFRDTGLRNQVVPSPLPPCILSFSDFLPFSSSALLFFLVMHNPSSSHRQGERSSIVRDKWRHPGEEPRRTVIDRSRNLQPLLLLPRPPPPPLLRLPVFLFSVALCSVMCNLVLIPTHHNFSFFFPPRCCCSTLFLMGY